MQSVNVAQAMSNDGKLITIQKKNVTIAQVMQWIEEKSTYSFFINDTQVNVQQRIDIDVKEVPALKAIKALFQQTNYTYEVLDKQVVVKIKQPQKKTIQKKSISGQVIDETDEPMIGANVVIVGTSLGTITDFDGNFTLEGRISPNDSLLVSYIGMKPQKIKISQKTNFNIKLLSDTKIMKEVVVTALGIKREKKMLGYAVQEIKSDQLNTTSNPSVTGALQGKIAGVQMNTASTGLGGSTKITIRGNSSLTDNNQPLWIVDGVPFSDRSTSGASMYGGTDRGSVTADINPDDIESVSVLKGPNAAALYGSRAGNGVILITTKKGSKKDGFGINYSGSCTWSKVTETLNTQTTYGQGVKGIYNPTAKVSFGPRLDGSMKEAWNGETIPYKRYGDKMKDYFHTGFSQNHSVSIDHVTEKSNFRTSFCSNSNRGMFEGERLDKVSIDLVAGAKINKKISIEGKVSLSKTLGQNRPVYGMIGEIGQLLLIPNNIRLQDLKHYYNDENMHLNWTGMPTNEYLNPYFINNQRTNSDERWRAFGYYGGTLKVTEGLSLRAKYSFDYYRTRLKNSSLSNGVDINVLKDITQDGMSFTEENFFEQNAEFILLGDKQLNPDFRIGYTLGGNLMYQRFETAGAGVKNMLYKNDWKFNTGKLLDTAHYNGYERATYSVFASAQLAYKEYLSLDLTARNDWSSTLPPKHNSFFYPSANLSFVISDFMKSIDHQLPNWITFAKLRLSVAQVGKDTEPYQLHNTYKYRYEGGKLVFDQQDLIKKNDQLKPEISTSYEAGLDMKFFGNRLGFDFTYYYSKTKNQIMQVPAASPWKGKLINAGLITNQGVELAIYSTPIKTKDFTFSLDCNLAHNVSKAKRLVESPKHMFFSGDGFYPINVGAVVGGKLGDIYAKNLIKRNEKGQMILKNGRPQPYSGEDALQKRLDNPIGSIQPDLMVSVTPSFTYKGFFVSTMLDMKFGGDILSMSEGMATRVGIAECTEKRGEIVLPGVKEDGTPNNIAIDAEEYYTIIGLNRADGFAELFMHDASYIKLKEFSVGYSFPHKWLKKTPFNKMRISFVGRNLFYLMKHTPGTNPEGGYDTSMFSQAVDFTSVPTSRTFGFSINVGL
jgi:TonB-linked SusC/RagA family outer membrane protein